MKFLRYFGLGKRRGTAIHLTNASPYSAPGGLERYTLQSAEFAEKELEIPCEIVSVDDPERVAGIDKLSVQSVHLQHSMNWPDELLYRLCRDLTARTERSRIYIHDYHFLCRQHNLLYNDDYFCGPPEDIEHGLCVRCKYGRYVDQHRKEARLLLNLFSLIVSPSESAKKIFCRAFPELQEKVQIVPHLLVKNERAANGAEVASGEKICVIFSGACGFNKGIHHYSALLETLGPRFRWATVGIEDRFKGNPLVTHRHYSFHESGDIKPILESLKPAVAFLGSVVPETFSYTLHEMLAAGIPVVTTALSGNIATTVNKLGCGHVFISPEEMKQKLFERGEELLLSLVQQAKRFDVELNREGLRALYS